MEQALLDSLTQRGMLEKEAVMYLTTLELGNAPASSIARKANIKRTTCYSILRDFEQRGIATSIMRKEIAYFSVVDPEILLKQLEDKYLTFKNNIPELQALQAAAHSKLKIQYYEGLNGLKQCYGDILKDAEKEAIIYAFIGAEGIDPTLEEHLYQHNIPTRVEKKIFANIIISDTPGNRKYAGYDSIGYKETKLIHGNILQTASEINLYGENKIALIMYASEELHATVITSQHLYDNWKSIFDFLWKL